MILTLSLILLLAQTSDPVLFAQARGHMENGEFSRAVELWRELAGRHPKKAEPWIYRSMAYRRGENFEAADRALQKAFALSPESPRAFWQLGLLRNLQQRYAEALDALDELRHSRPPWNVRAENQANFHYQRGVALQALDREGEAIEAMRRACERDADLFPAAYSLYLMLRSTDPDAAQAQLKQVEALRERQPDWIRNDMLRLEMGPLSLMEWPRAYEGLQHKTDGDPMMVKLEAVRSKSNGIGSTVEIWTGGRILRQRSSGPSLHFRIPQGAHIDVLRVVWSHGKAQNVFDIDTANLPNRTIEVREELFIKGSWGGVRIQD